MERHDIEKLIVRYNNMSGKEYHYGSEKCALYERIAGYLEDDIEYYADNETFSDEQEIIDDIKERIEGLDNCYDEDY